jgi:hypothetical protein
MIARHRHTVSALRGDRAIPRLDHRITAQLGNVVTASRGDAVAG